MQGTELMGKFALGVGSRQRIGKAQAGMLDLDDGIKISLIEEDAVKRVGLILYELHVHVHAASPFPTELGLPRGVLGSTDGGESLIGPMS